VYLFFYEGELQGHVSPEYIGLELATLIKFFQLLGPVSVAKSEISFINLSFIHFC
jgi:hypothetical protein